MAFTFTSYVVKNHFKFVYFYGELEEVKLDFKMDNVQINGTGFSSADFAHFSKCREIDQNREKYIPIPSLFINE